MKKKAFLLLVIFFIVFNCTVFSQVPPPPPNTGSEGGPVGGSAPIGDGMLLLIFLASAYASRKIYLIRQKEFNHGKTK